MSLLLVTGTAVAQDFEWNAGFDGFLDNREYFSIGIPKTMFGARLRGEIGASLGGQHRMRGGLNYLFEFGSDPWVRRPDVTLYYEFDHKPFDFFLGAFPRSALLDFPIALLSDTLDYYRPNIQGFYLDVKRSWGYENVFIDWTSRQTDTLPERFIFGFSGEVRYGILYFNHHFMMGHFAGAALEQHHPVRDNGGFDLNVGANLGELLPLDTLLLSAGTLVSLDRDRGSSDKWKSPYGLVIRGMVMWKGVGLEGLYYNGDGHTFLYGDPFYRLRQYGRLDVFWAPFRAGAVRGKLDVAFHFANGQVDYSQHILLSIDLEGIRKNR